MKKINILILLAGMFTPLMGISENVCHDKNGILRCGKGKIDTIQYSGLVEVNGSTVEQELNVNGNVNIENAHLNRVEINGDTHIENTSISGMMQYVGNIHAKKLEIRNKAKIIGDFFGTSVSFHSTTENIGTMECHDCRFQADVTLVGEIIADHSDFRAPISINTKNSQFSHSKLNDVFVTKPSHHEEQVIHLSNGTTAHNIVFESQKGLVILHDNAKITGSVQGAKVERK